MNMLRCFNLSLFYSFIKMINYTQEARRTQHLQADYEQWAMLRGVGGLRTGPKGHSVGSKLGLGDIKLFVFLDQTYSWLAAI